MGYFKPAIPFLLICFLQSRYAICQAPVRITLTEVNAPFSKVMDDLQVKAGVTYLGLASLVQLAHPVSFTVKDGTLKEVLDLCFKGQPFTYKLVEGAITILPLETSGGTILHGRVVDANNEPLSRVTVQVRGDAGVAVATDDYGEFRINTHIADPTLIC